MAKKRRNKKKAPPAKSPLAGSTKTETEQSKKENRASDRRPSQKTPETGHSDLLQGWKQIAEFLGQPVATAQRWAKTGMPARREGRFMVASTEELRAWLGREAGVGQPVHIATDNADLSTDLRRALAAARHHRRK